MASETGVAPPNPRHGIYYLLASISVFSLVGVMAKLMSDHLPPNEIAAARVIFGIPPVLVILWRTGGWARLRTIQPWAHCWRTVLGLMGMTCFFASMTLLPLADAIAISYAAPLFLTALSAPFLGEKVGPHRWSAVLVGFAGILVMAQPTGDVLNLGALVGLIGALCHAVNMMVARRLTAKEHPSTISLWFLVWAAPLTLATLPFSFAWPEWRDLGPMIGLGLAAGIGQYWFMQAFARTPASTLAPFNYIGLIWALVWGVLVFGESPTQRLLIGAALVAASGLYIAHRETVRKAPSSAGPPAAAD